MLSRFCLPVLIVGLLAQSALADPIYASGVTSVSGSTAGSASAALGAPDSGFLQLADNTALTLSFGSQLSGIGTLEVFTFDTFAPAAARIELSSDNVSFVELVPAPGTLWWDSSASGSFEISVNLGAGSTFQYIRFTDHLPSIDSDANPTAGFDLDAVGFTATPVPEPGTLALFGLGLFGLAIRRRRRIVATTG